jgi:CubicO group peptidase (beta-lactamase class C family)
MMYSFRVLLALAVILVPGSPQGVAQTSNAVAPSAEISQFVDDYMKTGMARDKVAGAVVAVVYNGETVHLRGYGHADVAAKTPADPEQTLFRIGSISKTFTWLAALELAGSGKLDLTADVNQYLPDALRIEQRGHPGTVSYTDLMAHAGGFDDKESYLFALAPERLLGLEAYLAKRKEPLVRSPGVFSSYSNYGAALAGYIAYKRASAADFPSFIDAAILRPAGMASTTFREPYPARADLPAPMPDALQQRVSRAYRWMETGFVPQETEYITGAAPAGSAYSTGADMARYMRLILADGRIDGKTVFSPFVAEKLRTPILLEPDDTSGWHHGFLSLEYPGKTATIGHNGATLYFRSNMILIPSRGLGIFIVANSDTSDELTEALPSELFSHLFKIPPPAAAPSIKRDVQDFVGTYRISRRAYSGMARFVRMLQSEVLIKAHPEGGLILEAGEAYRFLDNGSDQFNAEKSGVHGAESLRFVRDGADRVIRAVPGHNALAFERTPWWETITLLFGLLALLAAVSLIIIVLLFVRIGPAGQKPGRVLRRLLQVSTALLSLGVVSFIVWVFKTDDPTYLIRHWPSGWLMLSQVLWRAGLVVAVIALMLGIARAIVTPEKIGWNRLQWGAYFTGTAISLGFASILLAWGALSV